MPVIDAVLAVAGGFVVWCYAILKLVKWSLNADQPEVRVHHVNLAYQAFKTFLVVVVVLTFGNGLSGWLYDVWHLITGFIP